MHETVFKNRFSHRAGPLRNSIERHELGLHVSGETGVFGGAKRLSLHTAPRLNADKTLARRDGGARLAQLVDHCIQVVGAAMSEHDVAAGGCNSAQKGAGFNPVCDHLMRAAVQTFDALNADAARAVAFDVRAHLDEHFGQVANLRFLRCVFKNGFAFGQCCRHHQVFSARHGHHVGADAATLQAPGASWQFGQHVAMLDGNLGPHGLQALDVLVHRPGTDGASARQRDRGMAKTRQQRAQRQHRRAHGFHQLVGRLGRAQASRIQRYRAPRLGVALRRHAHVADQLEHGGNVLQPRHIFKRDGIGRQQGRTQLGQCGVLGA